MGRPKEIATRSFLIKFRVFALEKEAVTLSAQRAGLSVSEYARRCTLNQVIKARRSQQELELLQQLRKYELNFTRLGHLIRNKQPGQWQEIQTLIAGISEELKRLKESR